MSPSGADLNVKESWKRSDPSSKEGEEAEHRSGEMK